MGHQTNIKSFIAILVNPRSGKGKAVRMGAQIRDSLSKRRIPHQLFCDTWPDSLDGFSEAWIVGGDGTINYFINYYKGISIPLALFGGGTGNDLAWKLYGKVSLEEQIERVLSAEARPVDAASCNGQLYLNSLGIGFDGEVLQSMGAIRWLGGHLGYLWVVMRKIFSFREKEFTIVSDGKVIQQRFLLVIINNSTRTGGGFMVSPLASLHDGSLDMVLCGPLSVLKRLRYLPVIEKGKHLELPFIQYRHCEKIRVECPVETTAAMDGELVRGTHFDIRVLPGFFHFKF
ncbi:MAG: hypothetical protein IPP31_15080 [Chitinophagaceae bacterium]|nr:hypothetical protein [Chitinophagaceae bacterium]